MNDLARVTIRQRGAIWIVTIRGEIDMSNSQIVSDEMRGAIPNHAKGVVLDLTKTFYLDSRGISLVFQMARRLKVRGQELGIAVPDDAPIRAVLSLTEVASVAAIYPTVDAAEAGLLVLDP
ncbi:MAG: STAS domain-containing protein [Actinomycetota bacterium]